MSKVVSGLWPSGTSGEIFDRTDVSDYNSTLFFYSTKIHNKSSKFLLKISPHKLAQHYDSKLTLCSYYWIGGSTTVVHLECNNAAGDRHFVPIKLHLPFKLHCTKKAKHQNKHMWQLQFPFFPWWCTDDDDDGYATHTSDVDVWSAKFIYVIIIAAYQVPLLPQGLLENRDACVCDGRKISFTYENVFSENFLKFSTKLSVHNSFFC